MICILYFWNTFLALGVPDMYSFSLKEYSSWIMSHWQFTLWWERIWDQRVFALLAIDSKWLNDRDIIKSAGTEWKLQIVNAVAIVIILFNMISYLDYFLINQRKNNSLICWRPSDTSHTIFEINNVLKCNWNCKHFWMIKPSDFCNFKSYIWIMCLGAHWFPQSFSLTYKNCLLFTLVFHLS